MSVGPPPTQDQAPDPSTAPSPGFSLRSAILAGLVSMLAGLVISIWPHFVYWQRIGEPVFLADHDDGFYLSFTSQAYYEHPDRITDPILKSGGTTQFPWAQLAPNVMLCRALGLGPFTVLLVWRIWGGLTIGLTCYLMALSVCRRPWLAAAIAILFFSDTGSMYAKPIVKQLLILGKAATRGLTVEDIGKGPWIMRQWRLITPSVSFAFLLAHATLVRQARQSPTRGRIIAAGLSYGLLYYIYFYFWTAATVALGLLWLLDSGRRRVPFAAGLIGFVVGVPSLIANFRLKREYAPDWLLRMDNFLPIPRTSEWLWPIGTVAILAVAVAWALLRRRDLLYLACLAIAGLLMHNHQAVTGLQIQNWHWFYVWAPFTWLLLVFEVLPFLEKVPWRSRAGIAALAVALAAFYGSGLYLRAVESTRSEDSRALASSYVRYREQRGRPDWPGLVHNEVAAGDGDFLEIAAIWDDLRPLDHYALLASPDTLEPEREARLALNASLQGFTREQYRQQMEKSFSKGWGPWVRDVAMRKEKIERILGLFDKLATAQQAEAARFQVRYLGLPAGSPSAQLQGRWKLIQGGPSWDIYENLDLAPAPSRGK